MDGAVVRRQCHAFLLCASKVPRDDKNVFELRLIPAESRLGWWSPAAHHAHQSSPEAPVTGKEGTPTSGSATLELSTAIRSFLVSIRRPFLIGPSE